MKLHNKDTGEDGRLMMCHDYDEFPFFIEIGSIKIYYHNFAEMIEAGWDCVKIPAEPLIKDEKVRKAVRAWAEANSICRAIHYKTAVGTELIEINYEQPTDQKAAIEFNKYCGLEESKEYTIAELCGEEEE